MNNVSLIGRLTADPELKTTQSGICFTRFSIAVDRHFTKQGEEKQTDFISVVAWQKIAEFVCKYFNKGNRIALNGSIRTGNYTDSNGNKRYTFYVCADKVEFCEKKSEPVHAEPTNQPDFSTTYSGYPSGDDLPF